MLINEECVCGHPWKWHIYGEDRCVMKDCSCERFIKVSENA